MNILIAEDDLTSRSMLAAVLKKAGHEITATVNGVEALAVLEQPGAPRLAILDWMMPEMDGLEVVRRIRAKSSPQPPYLIMLTAKGEKADIIAGLDAGADDYVVKPFDLPELFARLRALLRRASGAATPKLTHGGVMLEPASKRVTLNGQPIQVSAREYALLHDLLSHRNQIRTRAQLEESLYAWGEETGSNTVEVYIHHLRKKLGADFIQTIRGLGYQLGTPGDG